MSPEKVKELVAIYPELFSDLPPQCPMSLFSIECGDGWFGILRDCIQRMKDAIANSIYASELKSETKCLQIKEKFGTLRIYLSAYAHWLQTILEDAETESEDICEECGGLGRSCKPLGFYIHTLCQTCEKQHGMKVKKKWESGTSKI
jgi:hypothetical protein